MQNAVTTRHVGAADIAAISRLHQAVFGPGRFVRSAYRVREGKGYFSRFCRLAEKGGRPIAALRMTQVLVGGKPGAALLGPLAVDQNFVNQGLGTRLITEALDEMRAAGVALVILVGDQPYYGRFGFRPVAPGQITFPGPVNPSRILGCELKDGALAGYHGCVSVDPNADAGNG